MTDLIESVGVRLAALLFSGTPRTVTIVRGSVRTTAQARRGKTEWQSQATSGVVEVWESVDFLFRNAGYCTGGATPVQTLPQVGDVIEDMAGGAMFKYEVLPPTKSDCYRFIDGAHMLMRVYTKLIE